MDSLTLNLVLGDDQTIYDALVAALPPGENNLARGVVVPSHPTNQPQTFQISNVEPNVPHIIDIVGEWNTAPTPRIHFIPITNFQLITVALPYGPVTMTVKSPSRSRQFELSVTNYAVMFRSYASQITQYSNQPLSLLDSAITSDLSYRLALPMLVGLTGLIPADLESLTFLSYKLLIKSLLHTAGSFGAVREILAAFSASNPYFFKMQNISKLDSPLYRSEEVFQGYEAHVWLPNKEIERWRAFITLVGNLPQLYTLEQITETEVYVSVAGKLKRHQFDFNSPFANSVVTGLTYLNDCFLKLFSLAVTVEAEHWLGFCQASYIMDQTLTLPAVNDPIAERKHLPAWKDYTLSGRFEQQYGVARYHNWVYDSPLIPGAAGTSSTGLQDGINRFFSLSQNPLTASAVKVFMDGLLKYLYVDYRVSISGDIISGGADHIITLDSPILIETVLGEARPFKGPVFSSLEVLGSAKLQMLLTGVETGLDKVAFVISDVPNIALNNPQNVAIHYVTPKFLSGALGSNQYGMVNLQSGITTYNLTYNQTTASLNYQLLVSLTMDPMPSHDPTKVTQVAHLIRAHSLTGASIDFSDEVPPNTRLNWWVIEDDTQTLERGTIILNQGDATADVTFTGGPYFDQVVVLVQLWNMNPSYIPASQYLTSFALTPNEFQAMFSAPIDGTEFRLDYCVYNAQEGNFIEFYDAPPPEALLEAHYDTNWHYWVNRPLSPNPDGNLTEFFLPMPCLDPKSVIIAIDGRIATQGANRQYTVSGDRVTFTFPPTPNQKLWAVYPLSDTNALPSSWEQGYLNRLPPTVGEYATGWLKVVGSSIAAGDSVSINDTVFKAMSSPVASTYGEYTVGNMGFYVTLNSTATSINLASNTFLGTHRFKDGDEVKLASTGNLPQGLDNISIYYIANVTPTSFQLRYRSKPTRDDGTSLNPIVTFSSLGSGVHTVHLLLGELVIDSSLNITGSTFNHPNFLCDGLKVTIVNVGPRTDAFDGHITPATDVTVLDGHTTITTDANGHMGRLPTGLSETSIYQVVNSTSSSFQLALFGSQTPVTLTDVGIGYQMISTFPMDSNSFNMATGFLANESVYVSSDHLPVGLAANTIYYLVNKVGNNFQLSRSVGGSPVSFMANNSQVTFTSVPHFAVGVSATADILALVTEIGRQPETKELVISDIVGTQKDPVAHVSDLPSSANGVGDLRRVTSTGNVYRWDGTAWVTFTLSSVTFKAKRSGAIGLTLAVTGSSMQVKDFSSSKDPNGSLVYSMNKMSYQYEAPLILLDGLSNRFWKQYNGNKFLFQYSPSAAQEAYFVSEVYPIDSHPMDSTVANQPECNYPKGVFTQGFCSHVSETSINARTIAVDPQTGLPTDSNIDVMISTANLPVQQAPSATSNPSVYNLSLPSCTGSQSLMLWIDGIFQNPDTYTYVTLNGSAGQITLDTPLANNQWIWAWYLPMGSACAFEVVEQLSGSVDGTNTLYTTSHPWADAQTLLVYLDGLFSLQLQDYILQGSGASFAIAPALGQAVWAHYNQGLALPVDRWRQVRIGVTDGVAQQFEIPNKLSTDLPLSAESTLVFLDGLNQGGKYTVNLDPVTGNPNGFITFASVPEANRTLDVAFIRATII